MVSRRIIRSKKSRWVALVILLFVGVGAPRPILHSHAHFLEESSSGPIDLLATQLRSHLDSFHRVPEALDGSSQEFDEWHIHWIWGEQSIEDGLPQICHASIFRTGVHAERDEGNAVELMMLPWMEGTCHLPIAFGSPPLNFWRTSLDRFKLLNASVRKCGAIACNERTHLRGLTAVGRLSL